MKKIGITQRVEKINDYGEVRDVLDQMWSNLLLTNNAIPIPLCNVAINIDSYLDNIELDGVILTGGNDIISFSDSNLTHNRDEFEFGLLDYAESNSLPVLGICRGMQVINVWNGGSISQIGGHVGTENKVIVTNSDYLPHESEFMVTCYHNFCISDTDLAKNITVLARSQDNFIEAIKVDGKKQMGIMWHPERVTPVSKNDVKLLRDYFQIA